MRKLLFSESFLLAVVGSISDFSRSELVIPGFSSHTGPIWPYTHYFIY